MKRTQLHVILLSLSVLIFAHGCATGIRDVALIGTVGGLTVLDADKDTALQVRSIALNVRDAIDAGGDINKDALRAQVIRQIKKLPQKYRATLIALVDRIVDKIIDAAKSQPLTSILVHIREAADGVVAGADIYIESLEVEAAPGVDSETA